MNPPFDLNSEFDRWSEEKQQDKILEDYFGQEVEYGDY